MARQEATPAAGRKLYIRGAAAAQYGACITSATRRLAGHAGGFEGQRGALPFPQAVEKLFRRVRCRWVVLRAARPLSWGAPVSWAARPGRGVLSACGGWRCKSTARLRPCTDLRCCKQWLGWIVVGRAGFLVPSVSPGLFGVMVPAGVLFIGSAASRQARPARPFPHPAGCSQSSAAARRCKAARQWLAAGGLGATARSILEVSVALRGREPRRCFTAPSHPGLPAGTRGRR